jgi:hypothetical protein
VAGGRLQDTGWIKTARQCTRACGSRQSTDCLPLSLLCCDAHYRWLPIVLGKQPVAGTLRWGWMKELWNVVQQTLWAVLKAHAHTPTLGHMATQCRHARRCPQHQSGCQGCDTTQAHKHDPSRGSGKSRQEFSRWPLTAQSWHGSKPIVKELCMVHVILCNGIRQNCLRK